MSLSSHKVSFIPRGMAIGGISASVVDAAVSSFNTAIYKKTPRKGFSLNTNTERVLKFSLLATALTIALRYSGEPQLLEEPHIHIPSKQMPTPTKPSREARGDQADISASVKRPIIVSFANEGSNFNRYSYREHESDNSSDDDDSSSGQSPTLPGRGNSRFSDSGGDESDRDRRGRAPPTPPPELNHLDIGEASSSLSTFPDPLRVSDNPPPPPPPPPSSTIPGIDDGIPSPIFLGVCALSGYLFGAVLFYLLWKGRTKPTSSHHKSGWSSSKLRHRDLNVEKAAFKEQVNHPLFPEYDTDEVYLSTESTHAVNKYLASISDSTAVKSLSTSGSSSEVALYRDAKFLSQVTATSPDTGRPSWVDTLSNHVMNAVYMLIGVAVFCAFDAHKRKKKLSEDFPKPLPEEVFDYAAMSKLLSPSLVSSADTNDDATTCDFDDTDNNVHSPPGNTDAADPGPEHEDTIVPNDDESTPVAFSSFFSTDVQASETNADVSSDNASKCSFLKAPPSLTETEIHDFGYNFFVKGNEENAIGLGASIHAPTNAQLEELAPAVLTVSSQQASPPPLITFEPASVEEEEEEIRRYFSDDDAPKASLSRVPTDSSPHRHPERTVSCSDLDYFRALEKKDTREPCLLSGEEEIALEDAHTRYLDSPSPKRMLESTFHFGAASFDRDLLQNAPAQSTFICPSVSMKSHAGEGEKGFIATPERKESTLLGVLDRASPDDQARHLSASIHAPQPVAADAPSITPSKSMVRSSRSFLVTPFGRPNMPAARARSSPGIRRRFDEAADTDIEDTSNAFEVADVPRGQQKGKYKEVSGQVDDESSQNTEQSSHREDTGSSTVSAPLDVAYVTDILIPTSDDRGLYRSIHAPSPEPDPTISPATQQSSLPESSRSASVSPDTNEEDPSQTALDPQRKRRKRKHRNRGHRA